VHASSGAAGKGRSAGAPVARRWIFERMKGSILGEILQGRFAAVCTGRHEIPEAAKTHRLNAPQHNSQQAPGAMRSRVTFLGQSGCPVVHPGNRWQKISVKSRSVSEGIMN
jgi:hypothetical protein